MVRLQLKAKEMFIIISKIEISNANLATAPFTVTSNGNLTAHTATLYDATFYATNANVKRANR